MADIQELITRYKVPWRAEHGNVANSDDVIIIDLWEMWGDEAPGLARFLAVMPDIMVWMEKIETEAEQALGGEVEPSEVLEALERISKMANVCLTHIRNIVIDA